MFQDINDSCGACSATNMPREITADTLRRTQVLVSQLLVLEAYRDAKNFYLLLTSKKKICDNLIL